MIVGEKMIVVEDIENKFCPFLICQICGEKIIEPGVGTVAYLPEFKGSVRVIFVHNCIAGKNCLDRADIKYGRLHTVPIDHFFSMLLHNTKVKFSKEDMQIFSILESI